MKDGYCNTTAIRECLRQNAKLYCFLLQWLLKGLWQSVMALFMAKKRRTFEDAITSLIEEAGSKSEAANRLDISPQYFSDIISGRRAPSERVARALGFSWVLEDRK